MSRSSRAFRRYGLTLIVPAVLAFSVLPAAPAWAATVARHQNVPRHVSVVSSRAVQGLYRCTSSPTCDIVNANMQFTNYSSVCLYQDCNFVSAADFEKVVLGIDPSPAMLKSEYANAGLSFRSGGLNMAQLWHYWRSKGIDGAIATRIVPYARSKVNTERAVSDFGAVMAELVTKKNSRIGTSPYGAGAAIILVDGFDPKGPLVVYQAKTLQMTWGQWSAYSRGMWRITASIGAPPPTTTTTTPITPSMSTVAFNSNGGSGAMTVETKATNTTSSLALNTFTRTGYTLTGWNTAANGSGVNYANGATYSFATSTTLYAQWTVSAPTTATITFNANGCSGYMANETEPLGATAALTPNAFTCSGYTFTGWNTASNGSGTSYTDGKLVTFTGNVTLYALWTATPITVPFTGSTSSNWSGYVLPSTSNSAYFTYVSGEWTVPTLNCAERPNSNSATWVGTGGASWASGGNSGALLQTGTEDDCVNGVQEDRGWWFLVDPSWDYGTYFSSFPISPGDTMVAKVEINTDGQWVTVLENLTTGLQGVFAIGDAWDVSTIASNTLVGGIQGSATNTSYSGGDSAEWVQEDETISSTGSLEPFANYGTVTFTNLTTNLSSWTLPNSDAYEIVQNGVTLSVPGPVVNDGFTATYTGP